MVAPLDWGLGHATRCIPIIRALLENGCKVLLAAEGAQSVLLQQEFPQLTIIPLRGYRVRYAGTRAGLAFRLLFQLPRLLNTIRKEHEWLQSVIRQYEIDLVISDNRYGLYSKQVPCVFITHQLTIKAPYRWLEKFIQRINYRYINRFTACWVPDAAGEHSLAGMLSHPEKMPVIPVHYLGLLSRWKPATVAKEYEVMVLLSGPEPQRTLLEEKILSAIQTIHGKKILVRGRPGDTTETVATDSLKIYQHAPGTELAKLIQQSDRIICRSGYTSLMELMALQKKMLLIPTPGQTEQEYLAKEFAEKGWANTLEQDQCNSQAIATALGNIPEPVISFPVFHAEQLPGLLAALQ